MTVAELIQKLEKLYDYHENAGELPVKVAEMRTDEYWNTELYYVPAESVLVEPFDGTYVYLDSR